MKTRQCELCGTQVDFPNGICLPENWPSKEELLRDMLSQHALIDAGLSGQTHVRHFNYFACEHCVNQLHQSKGVMPEALVLEMARNKALYLWETEVREKNIRPDEYPYPVSLDFSILHNPFVSRGKAMIAEARNENEKTSIYANIMAREFQFQRMPPFNNQGNVVGHRHIAIISETGFVDPTSPQLENFIARWLLKDAGNATVIYFSQYGLPHWFSYEMVEHLAISIAYNVPDAEHRYTSNSSGLTYECYVNTGGKHGMAVFWD